MQVSIEPNGALGRKLHISIPQTEVDKKVNQEVLAYSKKAKIDGFRPGKVPPQVIQQRFGDAIFGDVVQELIKEFYINALQQENINPAGQPKFEDLSAVPNSDISFVASIEVFPEFEASTMENVELEQPVAEIIESDIDRMVERVRKNHMVWDETNDKAKESDRVTLDITSKDESQEKPTHFENIQIILGEQDKSSQLADQLIGVCKDEERDVTIDDPADTEATSQEKQFRVKIKKVECGQLPELDDVFFKKCGVKEGGLDDFKKMIKEGMDMQLKTSLEHLTKSAVMDAILNNHQIDLPQSLIKQEIESMKEKMMQQANIKDASQVDDEMYRGEAEKRVSLGLIINQLAEQIDIKVDEPSIEAKLEEISSNYNDPESVRRYYLKDPNARYSLEAMVLEDKVISHVLTVAKVSQKKYSFDELVNQR